MLVNFISNVPRDSFSGGVSAVNRAALEALESVSTVNYVGPIAPPASSYSKAVSKLSRIAGFSGSFAAFSSARLKTMAEMVQERAKPSAAFDFFTGVTAWTYFNSPRPKVAWADCSFRDYIRVYHRGRKFRRADILRISKEEFAWLGNVRRVLITSHWAMERFKEEAGENPVNLGWIGIFGNEEAAPAPAYRIGDGLLFVSTDFRAKGGFETLAAFQILRRDFPALRLTVIGDAPLKECKKELSGVSFLGYLSKSDLRQRETYRRSLAEAFALVLPTQADIAPLTPLEAACFGTPTVSVRAFAIPELIEHEKSGILLEPPATPEAIAGALRRLMRNRQIYLSMRQRAQSNFHEHFSRNRFQQRILEQLQQSRLL
jgi:glycosyltransferase involved in cell wall biosynthesis